jgi:hypothetical protein
MKGIITNQKGISNKNQGEKTPMAWSSGNLFRVYYIKENQTFHNTHPLPSLGCCHFCFLTNCYRI